MDNIKRLKTERIDIYKPILPMSHNIDGHEDRMKALIKREKERNEQKKEMPVL